MCLFLTANMAAVTSRSAGDDASFSSLELSYLRSPLTRNRRTNLKYFFLYVTRNVQMELFRTNWGDKNGTNNY